MAATFEAWMDAVDRAVQAKTGGLSVYDLADQPFVDWHTDGISAKSAARLALQSEGF